MSYKTKRNQTKHPSNDLLTTEKRSSALWDENRGRIVTNRGGWRIGKAIYNCGYSMMDDLVGKKTFFQTLILNVTKKLPPRKLAEWFEASFICLSWPDSRIWCNQNGSLVGTVGGSPVVGSAIGILTADSRMYGPGAITGSAQFILRARRWQLDGLNPLQIVQRELAGKQQQGQKKPVIVGYSRPIATGDERVEAMEVVTRQLGYKHGEHLQLAFQIQQVLAKHYSENMNYAGYVTAFLADQGFSARDMYRIYSTWVHSGVHACYAEANDNARGAFWPWAVSDVEYAGPKARRLPARFRKS